MTEDTFPTDDLGIVDEVPFDARIEDLEVREDDDGRMLISDDRAGNDVYAVTLGANGPEVAATDVSQTEWRQAETLQVASADTNPQFD